MAWVKPLNSRSQVKKAGKQLVNPDTSPEDRAVAIAVVNNWRSAHSFPLNTLQVALRRHASKFTNDALIYQRQKRLPSIERKLRDQPTMDLARMQDLGGARAVLNSLFEVQVVVFSLLNSRMRHELKKHDDYIASPKPSGYRGHHLTYAYESDKSPDWNGLIVELQIRTSVQHAWATAVETVGLFTEQALKSSSGEPEWLRFFALASSAFALEEGTAGVPGTPTDREQLTFELAKLASELNVLRRLTAYSASVESADRVGGAYFVLTLDIPKSQLTIRGFEELEQANATYAELEALSSSDIDVVLVKTDSMASLRQAYPNYFLDTEYFIDLLEKALSWRPPGRHDEILEIDLSDYEDPK